MTTSSERDRRRLADARVGRLATVMPTRSSSLGYSGSDGTDVRPHVVPCCFVVIGDTIYSAVDGKPKSTLALKRLANIRARPRASLLVDHFSEDWDELWWVRADGAARVIEQGEEWVGAIDHLVAKYHQYAAMRPRAAVVAIDIDQWRSWSATATGQE